MVMWIITIEEIVMLLGCVQKVWTFHAMFSHEAARITLLYKLLPLKNEPDILGIVDLVVYCLQIAYH